VEAITGAWESLRHSRENLGQTANRVGPDAFAAHIEASMRGRWETGPEDGDATSAVAAPAGVVQVGAASPSSQLASTPR
jgi:hypothetical protein